MHTLSIKLADSVEEAPNYEKPEHLGANLLEAVVVQNGTEQGGATVDLVFCDEQGQKYVAMTTLTLLRNMVIAADARKQALDDAKNTHQGTQH
ncbi:MAG: hypothetical protein V2I66_08140 [Halieaceae bacterium]|jgi:hypothetical protein|nr:hypothetical protein [Halieaceae bacterium]